MLLFFSSRVWQLSMTWNWFRREFILLWLTINSSAKCLLPALCSGITPSGWGGFICCGRVQPKLPAYKANILSAILLLPPIDHLTGSDHCGTHICDAFFHVRGKWKTENRSPYWDLEQKARGYFGRGGLFIYIREPFTTDLPGTH